METVGDEFRIQNSELRTDRSEFASDGRYTGESGWSGRERDS
jgi:hypothetical protein